MAQNHFRHITQGRFICKGDSKLRIRSCSHIQFSWAPNGPEKGDAEQDFETYLVK